MSVGTSLGSGVASSVGDVFRRRVKATPDLEAFSFPDASYNWHTLTWAQVDARVRAIAAGLRSRGIGLEDRVAILSATSINWILADLGIVCAGGATSTIYPSNTAEECEFIITDSGARVVFADTEEAVDKLLEKRDKMPQLMGVVTFDGEPSADGWVITLERLEEEGRAHNEANPDDFDAWIDEVTLDKLATLIYTSGTTGRPKGVELLHDCWVYEGEAMDALGILTSEDKQFLWLPMSHSFGKVLEMAVLQIGIPTAVDGNIPKIVDNLAVVRPTFMAAAPRIFEKVYNKVITGAQEAGGLKWKIFRWACDVGAEVSKLRQQRREPSGLLAMKYGLATKLVFSKLQERFGGRLRFFISGSAPLSKDIAEFFHAAGILILEGYGLTESSAASFVNLPDSFAFGSVGRPLPGTEVKIADADDEIMIKGRGIMRGYWGLADVTAETLVDGWLMTGDIGEIGDDGNLRITDRKKDLIKTSGGKYVAPQFLESKLKALCPYVSQVVVHGNTRNFCTALVTLDPESLPAWAEDNGLGGKSMAELSEEPKVVAMVQAAVDQMNSGVASYETIKKFAILEQDFAVETGELTPSLKVKRKVVEEMYSAVLDAFYEDALQQM